MAPLHSTMNALASIEKRVVNPVFLPTPLITGHLTTMNIPSLNTSVTAYPLHQKTQTRMIEDLVRWHTKTPATQPLQAEIMETLVPTPIPLTEQKTMRIAVASPSPGTEFTSTQLSDMPLPRALNFLTCTTRPGAPEKIPAPYFEWTFETSRAPLTYNSSICNEKCSRWNYKLSNACCRAYPESHSTHCGAQSGCVYERWVFQCEHVGTKVTPLTALTYEFWQSEAMTCLHRDIPALPFTEWVTRYPLSRRLQLTAARERVELLGLCPRDARTDVFLKSETTTRMTDPRNISPRSDEILTTLGPVISAIEHQMVRNTDLAEEIVRPGCPSLVKGLDLKKRAVVLKDQLSGYTHYIETDYSRFDRTISLPMLRDVQDFVFRQCSTDHDFRHALDLALHTKGKSKLGVRYNIEGTRCSGDAHTSIGNGIINTFVTFSIMRNLPPSLWTSIHEGDDGVIGVNHQALRQAALGVHFINFLGFSVKQDTYNQIDDVSFCGRHYYTTSEGFSEHADVLRSLDKFHTTVSNCKSMPLIRAKALSYYSTDSETPLIGPLCYALLQATSTVSFSAVKRAWSANLRWSVRDDAVDFNDERPLKPISWEARLSVYRRTNITPAEQMWYEANYLQMAKRKTILVCPRIPAGWLLRDDGHVYGRIRDWIKDD